jgi:ribonuclease R
MKGRVGEEFRGVVTGVTSFGLFVTLETLYVEGLIHISELGAEYFQHNDIVHELRGERTGRRFRLYDPVSVLVSRVDLDARRIEFRLVPSLVRTTRKSRPDLADDDAIGLVAADDWDNSLSPPGQPSEDNLALPGQIRRDVLIPGRPSRSGGQTRKAARTGGKSSVASAGKSPIKTAKKPSAKSPSKSAAKPGRAARASKSKSGRRG